MSATFFRCAVACTLLSVVSGCGSRVKSPAFSFQGKLPSANVALGNCAGPTSDGVLSTVPTLRRADRDLNGDGTPEMVVADQKLCAEDGNCQWNVFSNDRSSGCFRYLGSVAGRVVEEGDTRSEDGFVDLRGWWSLGGGKRLLMHAYRFRAGAYRIEEVVTCRALPDDRLLCASE